MGEVLSHSRLSELIGSIYDCALDPDRWEATLSEVAEAFDCAVVSLTLNDLGNNRFLINKAAGWEPDLLRLKSERHVGEINARLTEWLTLQPTLDEMFVTSVHLSRDYIQNSLYVEECLKPQGIVDIMHMFLMHTHRQFAEIGLGRHVRQGAITPREIELGRLLLPHLRKVVTISNILDVRSIERAHMAEALDALRCGVVLTDEGGVILHANRSAEQMMRDGGPIRSSHDVLSASTPSASWALCKAIMHAARDGAQPGESSSPIRLDEADRMPAYAHVLPLATGDLRTRLQPDAVAAVFIALPDEQSGGIGLLAQAFNLTAAEIRTLEGLIGGATLDEIAHRLGIARSTAKTHLDHIFAKTGVSRRTELVRLAMQLSQPVHGTPLGPASPGPRPFSIRAKS
jgi:DNA-binding CsgD family transcriptional regulator/PAS domain-containing protein